MLSSLIKLVKFLIPEVENGYKNRAVIGGLDKITHTWESDARAENLPQELISTIIVLLNSYPGASLDERRNIIGEIANRIEAYQPVPSDLRSRLFQTEKPVRAEVNQTREKTPSPHEYREKQKTPANASSQHGVKSGQSAATHLQGQDPAAFNAPLTVLPGVGEKTARTLAQLGLQTLGDMLYYFPRRYDDYSQLKTINRLWYGETVTVIGEIKSINTQDIRGGKLKITEAILNDGSGSLRLKWFNQPWLMHQLRAGTQIAVSGKVNQYLGRLEMTSPEWEPIDQEQLHTNRIVPVYPLTSSITQRWLRRQMKEVVSFWGARVQEFLPEAVRENIGALPLANAIQQVHFPDSIEKLKSARYRLAFDEIFLLQLGVLAQKRAWQSAAARRFEVDDAWLENQISRLPFPLTAAQMRAIEDIRADFLSGRPMNRLLQGDVGSGKTVIAAIAAGIITRSGAQAAIMAPTSILAEQHYRNFTRLLAGEGGSLRPDEIRLLIGATPEAEKREIRAGLESGQIKIIIGTHALIESPIVFKDLQYTVVDEQHRFGVSQRAALRAKGTNPHLLVMTATPIPRSLALTVYGDLDLSILDEMPPGRQPVETHILFPKEEARAFTFIKNQIEQGRQAFIIYPLVEESEKDEALAAVEEHERLQKEVFAHYKLGLLHGRMKPDEKDAVMSQFRDGEYQILVSTSVIEVGVDVPNATVMMIHGANRFGLAQLHQFRGRVGRGEAQSYCLLVPDSDDDAENERLMVMTRTNDGFVLAEKDLEQRGPGDFLGTRQAGFSELRMASITDVRLIDTARREAQAIFEKDPDLAATEHQLLAAMLKRFWSNGKGDIS